MALGHLTPDPQSHGQQNACACLSLLPLQSAWLAKRPTLAGCETDSTDGEAPPHVGYLRYRSPGHLPHRGGGLEVGGGGGAPRSSVRIHLNSSRS